MCFEIEKVQSTIEKERELITICSVNHINLARLTWRKRKRRRSIKLFVSFRLWSPVIYAAQKSFCTRRSRIDPVSFAPLNWVSGSSRWLAATFSGSWRILKSWRSIRIKYSRANTILYFRMNYVNVCKTKRVVNRLTNRFFENLRTTHQSSDRRATSDSARILTRSISNLFRLGEFPHSAFFSKSQNVDETIALIVNIWIRIDAETLKRFVQTGLYTYMCIAICYLNFSPLILRIESVNIRWFGFY